VWIEPDELSDKEHQLAAFLKQRQYVSWEDYRLHDPYPVEALKEIASLARQVKQAIRRQSRARSASSTVTPLASTVPAFAFHPIQQVSDRTTNKFLDGDSLPSNVDLHSTLEWSWHRHGHLNRLALFHASMVCEVACYVKLPGLSRQFLVSDRPLLYRIHRLGKLPSPATDPKGPDAGEARVLRGGSWNDDPSALRVSVRNGFGPDYRVRKFGFRCARGVLA